MSTRFIRKESGTSKLLDRSTDAGVQYDTADGLFKYNDAGTVRSLITADKAQTLTNKTLTSPTLNSPIIASPQYKGAVLSGTALQTAGAATLTAAQSGALILFDKVDGIIFTLPAPVVGLEFSFFVKSTITSNNAKIITDAGTTFLLGTVISALEATTPSSTAGPKNFSANGTTHVACTMNGTTSGAIAGTYLFFQCITSTLWMVTGLLEASGTIITPFATS